MLSFYLVALGVAYPIGSLIQGPVVDRIGIGWTTTATALLLTLVLARGRCWPPAPAAPCSGRRRARSLGIRRGRRAQAEAVADQAAGRARGGR